MLDSLQQIQDTLLTSGILGVNWADNWDNFIFYTVLGLMFTLLYFYLRKRKDYTTEPNTWKELIKKYKDVILVHLVLYFTIIFAWITGGGEIIFAPITGLIRLTASIIGIDMSTGIDAFNTSIYKVMPKGQLTYFTVFWGYFMTSIIRQLLPNIWTWIYNKFFKLKEEGN